MSHQKSASWQDEEVRHENELCTTLMIATSGSDRLLTHDEVDRLLGVRARSRA